MGKRVGVVIPSYNQGQYLEKALLSAIANRRNVEMDIAVIDGGSEDNSVSIIKKYEKELKFWCSEPDKGQADAINKGIQKLSDCDFYLWLNSDDVYEDERAVAKLLEFAITGNYEVCYGLSHFIDKNGDMIGEYPVESFSYANLGKRCFLSQPSVLFSQTAYKRTGLLNEKLKTCLDYEYWIRLAQFYDFGFLREYIGATRLYEDTKTSRLKRIHLREAMIILLKYYHRVPMHWVVTKVLEDYQNRWLDLIPKRILMILLYPFKKRIIAKTIVCNEEG